MDGGRNYATTPQQKKLGCNCCIPIQIRSIPF
jgi:hypothetical protein